MYLSELAPLSLDYTLTKGNLSGLVEIIAFLSQGRHGGFGINPLVRRRHFD
jgi:hypothetical protein